MSNPKVLLCTLVERTSQNGTTYLAGRWGEAMIVAFKERDPNRSDVTTWQVYAQARYARDGDDGRSHHRAVQP